VKKGLFVLIIVVIMAAPVFAGVSLDLGISALGNAAATPARPLGAEVGIGLTLFDYRALVQVTGGFFSPPLSDAYNDPAGVLSAGILFSPLEYLYLGFRTGMITPIDTSDYWTSYGGMVIRVQTRGKGLHFYGESEISFSGVFNRFSMGINLTL